VNVCEERKETERRYNMNQDGASFDRIWLGIEAIHLKRGTDTKKFGVDN
jgi:hypothetical protein